MNFTRVTVSCKEIKAMAKHTMRGKWLKLALPMLLVTLLAEIPGTLFSLDTDSGSFVSFLIYALCIAIFSILLSAAAAYMLSIFRLDEHPAAKLLTPVVRKQVFLKSVGLFSLIALLTTMGFICFVIPGIIALYRYSQAFCILYDHPEYSPGQCLLASAAMMKGNKGQRFVLDLSFILWYLLPIVPIIIVAAPVAAEVFRVALAYMQTLTPEELEPVVTDEVAYAAFIKQFTAVETDAMNAYLAAHPAFGFLQGLANVVQMVLAAIASVLTGCSSACFYELASGQLTLKNESELYSAANDRYEV